MVRGGSAVGLVGRMCGASGARSGCRCGGMPLSPFGRKQMSVDRGAKSGQVPVPSESRRVQLTACTEAGSGVTPGQALVPAQTVIAQPLSLCPVPARVLDRRRDAATPAHGDRARLPGWSIRARGASDAGTGDALARLADQTYDLAIVIADDSGPWLERPSSGSSRPTTDAAGHRRCCRWHDARPRLALALDAMQAGAADLISAATARTDELATRLRAGASACPSRSQHGRERVERLRKLCKHLNQCATGGLQAGRLALLRHGHRLPGA
jgi:hypothetical protein